MSARLVGLALVLLSATGLSWLSHTLAPGGEQYGGQDRAYAALARSWKSQGVVEEAEVGLVRVSDSRFGAATVLEVKARARAGTLADRTKTAAVQQRLADDTRALDEADLITVLLEERQLFGLLKRCHRKEFPYPGREDRAKVASAAWNLPSDTEC